MFLRYLIGVVIVKKIVFLRDNKTSVVHFIVQTAQFDLSESVFSLLPLLHCIEAIVGVLEKCLL